MGRIRKPYTLFKRGEIWYYRTYDQDGYRTTAKSTGQTNKTAAVKYCEELHLIGNLNRSKMNFEQYAKDFYNEDSIFVKDRSRALSWNTVYHYRCTLKSRLLPYFGKMELCDITYSVLKRYRIKLALEVGSAQVNNIFAALRNILKYAYLDDIIPSNPIDKLEQLEVQKGTRTAFTIEEIRAIADNIVNYRSIVILCACTGMRISEAIGVQEEHIKQGKTCEYIDLQQQFDTRQRKYVPCKWNSSRKIPIIPELKEYIQPLIPYTTLLDALNVALEKLGIKGKKFHAFRHFFISDTENKNLNPLKVHYVAGHSMKGMQQIYTHMDVEQMSEILQWQKETFELLTK